MLDINNFKSLPRKTQIGVLNILQMYPFYEEAFVGIDANGELYVSSSDRILRKDDEDDIIISDPYVYEDFPFDKDLFKKIVVEGFNIEQKDRELADSYIYGVEEDRRTWSHIQNMMNINRQTRAETYSKIILDKIMEDTEWKRKKKE